jgi:uncharacterized protein
MLKIDVFSHILPSKYWGTLTNRGFAKMPLGRFGIAPQPALYDLEARFRIMEKYENYMQILNIGIPPVEDIAKPDIAAELSKAANDEMAELVMKYPHMFPAAVACIPMNDIDSALMEIDRAILELKFRGIQIYTTIGDKSLDSPEFEPIFERMVKYDFPILIHPRHRKNGKLAFSYVMGQDETEGEYWGRALYNWPFETTIALCALIYSGIMQKYPSLKIISHHCGGTLPYQANRILETTAAREMRYSKTSPNAGPRIFFTKRPYDYAKLFYGDTACYGNTGALMCGYYFFGSEHMLFGTDMPFDNEGGNSHVRETIRSIDEMTISDADKKNLYQDNAIRLFRLPL